MLPVRHPRHNEDTPAVDRASHMASDDGHARMATLRTLWEPEMDDPLAAPPAEDVVVTVDDILEGFYGLEREEAETRLRDLNADMAAEVRALIPIGSSRAAHLRNRTQALDPKLGEAQQELTARLMSVRTVGLRLLARHGDDEAFRRWMLDDEVATRLGIPDVRHVVTGKLLRYLEDAEDLLHEPTQHLPLATCSALTETQIAETLAKFSAAINQADELLRTLRLLAVELAQSPARVAIEHLRRQKRQLRRAVARLADESCRALSRRPGSRRHRRRSAAPVRVCVLTPIKANAPNLRHGPARHNAA